MTSAAALAARGRALVGGGLTPPDATLAALEYLEGTLEGQPATVRDAAVFDLLVEAIGLLVEQGGPL